MICNYKMEVSKDIKIKAKIEGQRIFNNNQKRERPNYQKRDNELEIDILGAMGELAVCEILANKKRKYKRNKSELNHPVKEPDIIVESINGNITIDVKTHSKHSKDWYINKKAFFDNSKDKSDFYWCIKFITDTNIQYEIFTKHEVLEWKIRKSKYTDVLFMQYGNNLKK